MINYDPFLDEKNNYIKYINNKEMTEGNNINKYNNNEQNWIIYK